jgi:hypothetical protein
MSRRRDDDNDGLGKLAMGAVIGAGVVIGALSAYFASGWFDKPPSSAAKVPVLDPQGMQLSTPVDEEAEVFLCPITQELMEDPVVTPCGHCFERVAIVTWIKQHGTDPMTRAPLQESQLVPCYVLKDAIARLKKQRAAQTAPTISTALDVPLTATLHSSPASSPSFASALLSSSASSSLYACPPAPAGSSPAGSFPGVGRKLGEG